MALTGESPKAKAYYEKDKKNILTAVLRNELLPQQLALAFACLEAPSVRQGPAAKSTIEHFIATLSDSDSQPLPPLEDRTMQELENLASLHQIVSTVA